MSKKEEVSLGISVRWIQNPDNPDDKDDMLMAISKEDLIAFLKKHVKLKTESIGVETHVVLDIE